MGLFKELSVYVNSKRPKTISDMIHHTIVASQIHFQQGSKNNGQSMKLKENGESKGKAYSKENSSKNPKEKEKRFKGKVRLSLKEMEHHKKENKCFKCGQEGHFFRVCPKHHEKNNPPRVTVVQTLK